MFKFRLAFKLLNLSRTLRDPTSLLAIFGMALGVSSLIATMSVFSGFESALKNAIIDVVGHMTITRRGNSLDPNEKLIIDLKNNFPEIKTMSPYFSLEAIATSKGKISGVRVEGLDPETYRQVIQIEKRIIAGQFVLDRNEGEEAPIMIGKGLAKTLSVTVGDSLKIILPKPSQSNSKKFSPRVAKFIVKGILDLGKYDFNERVTIVPISATQAIADVDDRVLGFHLKLTNADLAPSLSPKILKHLGGYPFWTRTWYEVNQNLLDAIRIEKVVIFLLVLIMVVAACFNVASTLYVKVIARYAEISILKAMGGKNSFILKIFALQGMLLGALGATTGVGLGIAMAKGFKWAEERFALMPADVYKVEVFSAEIRWTDMGAVFFATFLVCFLATLIPAFRGAKLNPREGLRYD